MPICWHGSFRTDGATLEAEKAKEQLNEPDKYLYERRVRLALKVPIQRSEPTLKPERSPLGTQLMRSSYPVAGVTHAGTQ